MPILRRLSWPRDVVITTDPHKRVFDPRSLTAYSGTAQAGSTNTLTLKADGSPTSLLASRRTLVLTGGAGSTQTRKITHYDGATKVATVSPRWSTNRIRNSVGSGAVAGSPGTLPTFWIDTESEVQGLTRTVSVGTDSGISYVGIRYSGTPTAIGDLNLSFDNIFSLPFGATVPGDVWTISQFWKLAAGTMTGVSAVLMGVNEHSDTHFLYSNMAAVSMPTSEWSRPYATLAPSGPNTTRIGFCFLKIRIPVAVPVDFTLHLARAQIEKFSSLGDYIATSGSAVLLPNATTTYNIPLG